MINCQMKDKYWGVATCTDKVEFVFVFQRKTSKMDSFSKYMLLIFTVMIYMYYGLILSFYLFIFFWW